MCHGCRRHSPQPPSRGLQQLRTSAVGACLLLLLLLPVLEAGVGAAEGQQCSSTDGSAADASQRLVRTAAALVARGKGILAADESTATMGKRCGCLRSPHNAATPCTHSRPLYYSGWLGTANFSHHTADWTGLSEWASPTRTQTGPLGGRFC
jgi:hypothetical protein